MADSEIMQMIPADRLQEIKHKDPRPLFKAFVIGHEGEARGNLIGIGNVIKRWFQSTIRKLHEKITAGIQLFHGHGATNEHDGRIAIGEVVGKRLMDINGRESVVVACYINKDFCHLPLDVASIETDVEMRPNSDGSMDVVGVDNVTGIALGNSKLDTPGFPGATLLGQLQAFAKENGIDMGYEMPGRLKLGYRINNTDQPDKLRLV
jgi:hypothetical protein